MDDASQSLQYEKAAQIRDQIKNLWPKLTNRHALERKYQSMKLQRTKKLRQLNTRPSKLTHPKQERINNMEAKEIRKCAHCGNSGAEFMAESSQKFYCGDCLNSCYGNFIEYKFPGLSPNKARNLWLIVTVVIYAVFMGLARI